MALSAQLTIRPRAARWRFALLPGARLGLLLVGQFALLVAISSLGALLVQITAVPLPGNLVGMLLLLLLLRLGIVRLGQVQELATIALRHLNFFFVPLAVGLMSWTGLLTASGAALGMSLVGSVVLCLAVTGLIGQRLIARGGDPDDR